MTARQRTRDCCSESLVALLLLALIAACGGAPTDPPIVDSHDAPEVEELLPETVAGHRLLRWSVRGDAALRLWGLSAEERARVGEQLTGVGAALDDVVQATAGRGAPNDPPYFVLAFRIPETARDLLGGFALASAGFTRETVDWQMEDLLIGGKTVEVGASGLLIQSEHQRGRPYLYGSEQLGIAFIVIADDESWAEDAIRQLPS